MKIAIILGISLIILIVSLIAWWQMRKTRLKERMVERGFTTSDTPTSLAVTGSGPPITEAVACVGCDYNLYGLAADGQCPECSCPIHISIPPAAPLTTNADEAGALEAAVPCVGCGNDLKGSRRHQSCPTCGALAWFSVPTTWLRHCDPDWLRRVRSGLTLWLWTMLIAFVLSLLAGIIAVVWAVQASTNTTRTSMLGSAIASAVAVILNMLVVWRITTPNPALGNRDADTTLRQVTRAGAIMALVSSLGLILVLLSELPKFYLYVDSLIGLGGWVSSVGLFLYLREFACRVPNRKFIRSFTLIMWWLCSVTLTLQLMGIGHIWLMDLDSTQTTGTPPPGTLAYSCGTGVVGLATMGLTIWLVVMLFRLRAAFRPALVIYSNSLEYDPDGPIQR